MTIHNNYIIINIDFYSSMNGLDNQNLENKKRNESTNMTVIIQEPNLDKLCNFCFKNQYIQIINVKPIVMS